MLKLSIAKDLEVKDKTKYTEIEFYLYEYGGEVYLKARNKIEKDIGYFIAKINTEGRLYREPGINDTFGLPVDELGRIQEMEKY